MLVCFESTQLVVGNQEILGQRHKVRDPKMISESVNQVTSTVFVEQPLASPRSTKKITNNFS